MKAIRVLFTITMAFVGFVPLREPLNPQLPGTSQAFPKNSPTIPVTWLGPNEKLAAQLRRQGRDPRLYLVWEGYPLQVAQSESITLGGAPFEVVKLVQAIDFVPWDCVERYVLLDKGGAVQDVATLHWTSNRRFEIEGTRCFGEPSNGFLEIRDAIFHSRRDTLHLPYVELGIEPGRLKRVLLPWTGTPTLGRVWIEDHRFKVERAKD